MLMATKFASDFVIFALGLSYGLSKSKNGVNSLLNFERSYLIPQAKIKKIWGNVL